MCEPSWWLQLHRGGEWIRSNKKCLHFLSPPQLTHTHTHTQSHWLHQLQHPLLTLSPLVVNPSSIPAFPQLCRGSLVCNKTNFAFSLGHPLQHKTCQEHQIMTPSRPIPPPLLSPLLLSLLVVISTNAPTPTSPSTKKPSLFFFSPAFLLLIFRLQITTRSCQAEREREKKGKRSTFSQQRHSARVCCVGRDFPTPVTSGARPGPTTQKLRSILILILKCLGIRAQY